jgi:cysteinyl-tRNA synthetase
MTILLQDTLSGERRELVPLRAGHVGIYSCGPTVYGPTHVGNFR